MENSHPKPSNTKETPLVYQPAFADAGQWQWCKCKQCGIVAICTPESDFYGKPGEPMECEFCFMNRHGFADKPVIEMEILPGETPEQAMERYNRKHGTSYKLEGRLE